MHWHGQVRLEVQSVALWMGLTPLKQCESVNMITVFRDVEITYLLINEVHECVLQATSYVYMIVQV